jgi:hypothetical protein
VKKRFLLIAFVSAFLLSVIVVSVFIGVAEANPYFFGGEISPPPDAVPIVISVSSPTNTTLYGASNITVAFNASSQETSLNCITRVRYTADWLPDEICVYQQDSDDPDFPTFIEHETTYQVPDGNHSLIIEARGPGSYVDGAKWTKYSFSMTTTLAVNFTVDTTPPSIFVLSPENKTYDADNVTLNFTVSEAASQVSYVLDGGENLTAEGNITLADLPNGEHNVTVYATDLAGHVGASETVYFSVEVPEPFPTVPVAATSVAAVVVVGAGLLVYFKKRRR